MFLPSSLPPWDLEFLKRLPGARIHTGLTQSCAAIQNETCSTPEESLAVSLSLSLSRKDLRRFDELANRAGPSSTSKPSTSAPSRTSRSTRRWRRRWRPPRTRSQAQRTGPAGLADLPLLQLALNCLRYLRLGCYSSKYQWCGWRIWESEILFS